MNPKIIDWQHIQAPHCLPLCQAVMEMNSSSTTLTLAYMNIRGQTGLDESKQVQIESFIEQLTYTVYPFMFDASKLVNIPLLYLLICFYGF